MTIQENMDMRFTPSRTIRIVALIMVFIGLVALVNGFITHPQRSWANLLLNHFYFLSLAIGAAFFLALQYISQSGWSAMFKRIPEAMMHFFPIVAITAIILFFGLSSLYHWAHEGATAHDPLLAHKAPYLNTTFFIIRQIVFFTAWIVLAWVLRRLSIREDLEGGMTFFEKSEFWSKVFIFVIAISFSFASFDLIMSIDPHWYSTIFSLKNFVAAFYHGTVVIALIAIILHEKGYFPHFNQSHLLDFSRYIFMLSIVWGYLFFVQFMLIWYANIPEETMYFTLRWEDPWFKIVFFLNIIINWFIPFTILLWRRAHRSFFVMKIICILLIFGQFVDLYEQIIPGILGKPVFGLTEVGMWLGFAGLFILMTVFALGRASIIPRNHPYLSESENHHVHL